MLKQLNSGKLKNYSEIDTILNNHNRQNSQDIISKFMNKRPQTTIFPAMSFHETFKSPRAIAQKLMSETSIGIKGITGNLKIKTRKQYGSSVEKCLHVYSDNKQSVPMPQLMSKDKEQLYFDCVMFQSNIHELQSEIKQLNSKLKQNEI